jgi:catechol 2,3-dioxygenase-like lactoylglutathione lyase family enzyme
MIDVERVDYIRVPVKDIEEAKHFYGQVLGLRENPNSPGDDWIEYEVGNVTLAVMTPHTHEYEFAPASAIRPATPSSCTTATRRIPTARGPDAGRAGRLHHDPDS